MRRGTRLVIALVLALCGCSEPAGNEAAGTQSADTRPTLVIIGEGSPACSATWNGEAITREALSPQLGAQLERAIAAAGGVGQLQELPVIRVEADLATGWGCTQSWLVVVQRSGFPQVWLTAGENDESGPRLGFPVPGMAPPRATVTIAADGSFAWEGEKVDAAGLAARVSGEDTGGAPPVVAMSNEIRIDAAAGVTFGAVREVAAMLEQAHAMPVLSAEEAPAPAAAPE